MKTFKAICATLVLALSLSIPAYAGDGHTPGSPVPGDVGTPTTVAGDSIATDGISAVDGDTSSVTLTDILWALVSIY
jgi:hypothetical protein